MDRTQGLYPPHAAALFFLLAFFCLLASPWARAALGQSPGASTPRAPVLVLNTDGAPPHSRPDGTGFEDRIVAEAFRRIGVAVRLVQLPSERSLRNADQGIDDGSYVRIAGLSSQYPNLIMVPEPVSEFRFTVFTRDPALAAAGWDSLRSLRVGIVNGWKIAEQRLHGAPQLTKARDEEALFALLDKGRVQAIVSSQHSGMAIVHGRGYAGVRAVSPPLAVLPMYLYLNKKHAALVPRLGQALQGMRRDGSMQRLTRAGLGEAKP